MATKYGKSDCVFRLFSSETVLSVGRKLSVHQWWEEAIFLLRTISSTCVTSGLHFWTKKSYFLLVYKGEYRVWGWNLFLWRHFFKYSFVSSSVVSWLHFSGIFSRQAENDEGVSHFLALTTSTWSVGVGLSGPRQACQMYDDASTRVFWRGEEKRPVSERKEIKAL